MQNPFSNINNDENNNTSIASMFDMTNNQVEFIQPGVQEPLQIAVQEQPQTPPQIAVQEPLIQPTLLPGQELPELEANQTIICKIAPGKFEVLIKILSLFDDKNIININKSVICQSIQNDIAILKTNVSNLLDNDQVNLDILNPKKYIKIFKAIKNNNDIFIIDDPNNQRYIVRSGKLKLWLPKQIEPLNSETKLPDLNSAIVIGKPIIITKEERSSITALLSDKVELLLLIQDDQIKGYSIPELLESPFKTFENEEVSEAKAGLKLISTAFLCVNIEGDYTIVLGQIEDKFWLKTIINNSIVDIEILESISSAQSKIIL